MSNKKQNEQKDNGLKVGLIILVVGILGIIIYRIYFAPKYSIIYEIVNPTYEYAKDGTPVYSDILECEKQVTQFNSAHPPFKYKCAKNCELDSTGVYIINCEEVYE